MMKGPFDRSQRRPENALPGDVTSRGKTPAGKPAGDGIASPQGRIVQFPGTSPLPSEVGSLLSYLSDINPDTVEYSLAIFKGQRRTIPASELPHLPWSDAANIIAPEDPPVEADKTKAMYVGAYKLRDAPLVGKTREQAEKDGRPLVGKQRSNAHVEACGPLVMLDIDGNVFQCEQKVQALGCRAQIYASHSYGKQQDDGSVKYGGRIVLAGDRPWTPEEHPHVIAAANHLMGGAADPQAMSLSNLMGAGVKRSSDAPYERRMYEGGVLSIDKLVDLGRSVSPIKHQAPRVGDQADKWTYSPSQVALALGVLPNDSRTDYNKWMLTAGAVRSALRGKGLTLFMDWSAKHPKHDPVFAEKKYLEDGDGIEFDGAGLMWTTRLYAESIAHTLYPAMTTTPASAALGMGASLPPAALLAGRDVQSINAELSSGIRSRPQPETLGRDQLQKQFGSLDEAGTATVAFMHAVWPDHVYRQFLAEHSIPASIVAGGEARATTMREKDIVGDCTVIETGGGIGGGIERVVAAIVRKVLRGELDLYQQGRTALCRLMRELDGKAKVVPVQNSATLRTIIAEHVKLKVKTKDGKVVYEDIRFTGKGFSAEFDPGMLKDLFERALPEALPELTGMVTMPIMPALPATGQVLDARCSGVATTVTVRGYHDGSRLYLA